MIHKIIDEIVFLPNIIHQLAILMLEFILNIIAKFLMLARSDLGIRCI
jgi:hypothetical protein